MRVLLYFIILALLSCSSGSQKTDTQVDTAKSVSKKDTIQENNEEEIDFRKEFISLYKKPVFIDTSFVDNGKKYEIVFHHFCTMDNGLVIPARYNSDTNKDFVTHNFASDLTVLEEKDTVFKKHISKATFKALLDTLETPLNKYATLLYPTLEIKSDSVQIHYSISIPVTDVGIGVYIRFNKKGSYIIRE